MFDDRRVAMTNRLDDDGQGTYEITIFEGLNMLRPAIFGYQRVPRVSGFSCSGSIMGISWDFLNQRLIQGTRRKTIWI